MIARHLYALLPANLVLAAFLVGCVQGAPLRFEAPPTPFDFGYRGGDGRELRVSIPFADTRPRPACSTPRAPAASRRPSHWLPTYQDFLACNAAPPQWLAEQLTGALQVAGFRPAGPGPLADDALDVQGTLLALEMQTYPPRDRPLVDLWIDLRVSTPSGLSASRSFFVKAYRGARKPDFTPVARAVLAEAVYRAVRDMTAAVLSLSNRYPPQAPLARSSP